MNAQEALEMLKKCGTNTVEPFESQILAALESAIAELAAIKQRGEEIKKQYDRSSLWQKQVCEDIDYILKGETK